MKNLVSMLLLLLAIHSATATARRQLGKMAISLVIQDTIVVVESDTTGHDTTILTSDTDAGNSLGANEVIDSTRKLLDEHLEKVKKIIEKDAADKEVIGTFMITSDRVVFVESPPNNSWFFAPKKKPAAPKDAKPAITLPANDSSGLYNQLARYEKIEVFVKQSAVYAIRVTMVDMRIYEIRRHIELRDFNEEMATLAIPLVNMTKNGFPENINLSNTIVYVPKYGNSYVYSKEKLIELNAHTREDSIKYDTGLNSMIEYRIFSDLLGLFNEEDNGLVQGAFRAKVDANLIPVGQTGYFFRSFEPFFNVSKFDNSIQSIELTDITDPDSINKTKVDQLAFISFGVIGDLYSLDFRQHRIDIIKLGASYSYTSSMLPDGTTQEPLNIITLSLGMGGQFLKYKNFGLDFSLMFEFKEMRSKNFKKYDSYDPYYNVGACLFYNPIKSPNSKIFLRFNSVEELKSQNRNMGKGYYSTIQFGYSATLNF